MIESQTVFTSNKLKKSLLAASSSKINQFNLEFQSQKATAKMQPKQKNLAQLVLEELAHIKNQSAQLASALNSLNKSVPKISSYNLLKVMFNIVLIHMYQEPWGTIGPGGLSRRK